MCASRRSMLRSLRVADGAACYFSAMEKSLPALLNAILDATGRRFPSLPVTQAMLKEPALAGVHK